MKSIIIAVVIGGLLFAASAYTSSIFFVKKEEPAESDPITQFDGKLPMVDSTKAQEQMPLGIRPDVPMPPSVALDLMNSIIQSEKKLQEKEERLKKEEKRISLLREDLERERSELESFSKKIVTILLHNTFLTFFICSEQFYFPIKKILLCIQGE